MECPATNNQRKFLSSISNMKKITQTESGKAWEYGLARQFVDVLNNEINLVVNGAGNKSQNSYDLLNNNDRRRIDRAAGEAVVFLRTHDSRLLDARRIELQADSTGQSGDVRDILIYTPETIIGISAKHRHKALKHPRLSDQLDFGEIWYGQHCTTKYWEAVLPVFHKLQKKTGQLWRDLDDKHEGVYIPLLNAFIREIEENADPEKMLRYLLGRHDFYKIIKENGHISIQSFNMSGNLQWGSRIPMPKRIVEISMKPRSKTTAIMTMDRGWQVSFRVHNAESKILPSLKFDVQLEGCPQSLSRHEIPYG